MTGTTPVSAPAATKSPCTRSSVKSCRRTAATSPAQSPFIGMVGTSTAWLTINAAAIVALICISVGSIVSILFEYGTRCWCAGRHTNASAAIIALPRSAIALCPQDPDRSSVSSLVSRFDVTRTLESHDECVNIAAHRKTTHGDANAFESDCVWRGRGGVVARALARSHWRDDDHCGARATLPGTRALHLAQGQRRGDGPPDGHPGRVRGSFRSN